ncbi:hypothetical protein HPB47_002787 [Ixodes persulcatus]|uniref:Uncharacterized protein n=1 Tax=Ixodes persulcatus TaxID=34615 RepID=A0AC60PK72_IXOPE|nr:hypothetical protein HPB47_002787 [Ixodes persulcatus]
MKRLETRLTPLEETVQQMQQQCRPSRFESPSRTWTPSGYRNLCTPLETYPTKMTNDKYTVWQWNCRSYQRKRGNLQQHLISQQTPPAIICLQETGGTPKLASYKTYQGAMPDSCTATLEHRNSIALRHDIAQSEIDHVLLEITALGLPIGTSTDKLRALGVHNTVEELIEGHLHSQYTSLTSTATGRHILAALGIQHEETTQPKMNLPREVRKHLLVSPLPKNMHPEYHDARRRDRCKHLHERYHQDLGAVYTDAADHATNPAMTMVVTNSQGVLLSGGSIATTSTEDAEETAIALALTLPNATTIISDSMRAVQNYARGCISRFAVRIHGDFVPTDTVSIVWAPAHSSLPGNDFAHNTVRELAYRAAGDRESGLTLYKDVLNTYQEITQAYRLARKRYPAGHKFLSKAQEHTWRRLQTNTYPHPTIYSHIYPDRYTGICKFCPQPANLTHMKWGCPNLPKRYGNVETMEQWDTLMCSSDPVVQAAACEWAAEAAGAQGLPVA